jgi:hypothetical protein
MKRALLFVLTLLVAVAWSCYRIGDRLPYPPGQDQDSYLEAGQRFVEDLTFYGRAPVYSVWVGCFYELRGKDLAAAFVTEKVASVALLAALTGLLAWRIFSFPAGLLLGCWVANCHYLLLETNGTHTLAAALYVGAALCLTLKHRPLAVSSALVLTYLSCQVRSEMWLALMIILVVLAWNAWHRGIHLAQLWPYAITLIICAGLGALFAARTWAPDTNRLFVAFAQNYAVGYLERHDLIERYPKPWSAWPEVYEQQMPGTSTVFEAIRDYPEEVAAHLLHNLLRVPRCLLGVACRLDGLATLLLGLGGWLLTLAVCRDVGFRHLDAKTRQDLVLWGVAVVVLIPISIFLRVATRYYVQLLPITLYAMYGCSLAGIGLLKHKWARIAGPRRQSRLRLVAEDIETTELTGEAGAGDTLLTTSLLTFLAMQGRALPVRGLWEFVSEDDRRRIHQEAEALRTTWYAEFRDSLVYDGVNIGDVLGFSFFFFLLEALTAAVAARQLRERLPADTLCLPRLQDRPARYSLGSPSDVTAAVLAWCAGRQDMRLQWSEPLTWRLVWQRATTWARRATPAWLRRWRRRWLVHAPTPAARANAVPFANLADAAASLRRPPNGRIMLGVSAGPNFLLQACLAQELQRSDRWDALLCHVVPWFDGSQAAHDPTSRFYLGQLDRLPVRYLELFQITRTSAAIDRMAEQSWRRFIEWQRNYRGPWPEVFANPHLRFQFQYFFLELMPECCKLVSASHEVLRELRPDVVLVGNGSEKDCVVAAAARSAGVPTMLVPHTRIWAHAVCYEFDVDYIALPTEGLVRYLEPIAGPRQPIAVIDALAPLLGEGKNTSTVAAPAAPDGVPTLVALIGWISPGLFQFFDLGKFGQALAELVRRTIAEKPWRLVLRIHPRSPVRPMIERIVREHAEGEGAWVAIECQASAEELIARSDAMLQLDYKSSPVVEAWRLRKPVVYWQSSKIFYGEHDMLDDALFAVVHSFDQLRSIMGSFREDASFAKQWTDKGWESYQRFFGRSDEAGPPFAEVLEGICHAGTVRDPSSVA